MRTITNFTNDRGIPPLSEREWNYSFEVGERVKLIPEMVKNIINDPFLYSRNIISLSSSDKINKIGVIKNCYPEIHCNFGTSYMCVVDFDGLEVTLMSSLLYTSLKFYK